MEYMQAVYFTILLVAAIMEFSPRFNTNNFIKKLALLLIILGALAHMARKSPPLIEIGFAIYLLVELCGSVFHDTFERRHRPEKKRLLS